MEEHDAISDHPEWLACAENADCTSIELGCWYWEPVNKKYIADLKKVYPATCAKSVPAGPQRPVRCLNYRCENGPNTVQYWKQLDSEPYLSSIKNQLIRHRMDVRLQATAIQISTEDFTVWRDRSIQTIDEWIHNKKYSDEETIDPIIDAALARNNGVAFLRLQDKWTTLQSGSTRQVRVDRVEADYSLDQLYPPLIRYAEVFQQCGQNSSRAGIIFSGEMHARFTIKRDGTVDSGSLKKTSYPGVAYMSPYLACARSALEKMTFPTPQASEPVKIEAIIEILVLPQTK